MSERKMRLVDSNEAAFIVKNAPEYIEGMVTSTTLERWRKALRALTLQPDGEAIQIDSDGADDETVMQIKRLTDERNVLRAEVGRLRAALNGEDRK